MRNRALLILGWLPLALAGGCTGGGGSDDDDDGGDFHHGHASIQAGSGISAEAALHASAWDHFPVVLDTCFAAGGAPEPVEAPPFVDAGTVRFAYADGTSALTLNPDSSFLYEGSTPTAMTGPLNLEVGGTEDVTPSVAENVAELPRVPTILSTLDILRGADFLMEWTGSGGGWFTVQFFDGGANPSCRMIDDGSFVIPAALTAILGSNGGVTNPVVVDRRNVFTDDLEWDVVIVRPGGTLPFTVD